MLKNRRGVTLVELMVATVIMTVVVLGGMASFRTITQAIRQSRTKTIAGNLAQEKMEVLKNLNYFQLLVSTAVTTDTNYDPNLVLDMAAYSPETIALWGQPEFRRGVFVAYAETSGNLVSTTSATGLDTGLKQVTVFITWRDGSTYKKIEVKNLVANPSAAALDASIFGNVSPVGGGDIADALIRVIGNSNWEGQTDSAGNYSFAVANGTYSITCSSAGYFPVTVHNVVAYRNTNVQHDFTLVPIASSTVSGSVWISSHILISAVVVSSDGANHGGANANEIEGVELYNPTTFTWTMDAASFSLWYREKNGGGAAVETPLTFNTAVFLPETYYLIASTTTICIDPGGSQTCRTADAVYTTQANVMKDASDGGLGIRARAGAPYWDKVGWAKGVGPDPPWELVETSTVTLPSANGMEDGMAFMRRESTGPTTISLVKGNSYDSDVNTIDFGSALVMPVGPRNSTIKLKHAAGTPAFNAFVACNDTNSQPVLAQRRLSGGDPPMPYAQFTLNGVSTGSWIVTIVSGTYYTQFTSVGSTQGIVNAIPNEITGSTWPVANYHAAILKSTTSSAFVHGYVFGAGPQYDSPLGGILMEANGSFTRTMSNGYYMLNVGTGTIVVNANFGYDNANYGTAQETGDALNPGSLYYIPPSPYFHLGQGGTVKAYASSGTGALPNTIIKATVGSAVYTAITDNTGYAYIKVTTAAASYQVKPELSAAQSYTGAPVECAGGQPMTCTVDQPGETVWAGTFTVTGAMGRITGNVEYQNNTITTGVLIIASVGNIADPPPSIAGSSAPALTNAYFSVASQADGTYSLEVVGGSYKMAAYYPVVDTVNGTVTYSRKDKTGINVTAGAATSNQDFDWP